MVDEVCQGHINKYKVIVNDMPVDALYNTGASMSCMTKRFFDTLTVKPKQIPCNRSIAGAGGEILRPVGECFICLQIGKRVFRDRVVVIDILRHKYILGQVLHRSYWFGTGYSAMGKHFITINGQVITQSISQPLDYPIVKTKGRITLPPVSVLILEIKTPKLKNTMNLYKMNAVTAQLPEGMIPLDILHRVDHKTLQYLNIPVLNTNNVPCSIGKNMPIASMHPMGMCEEVQRSAEIVCGGTPPNSYHKYCIIPGYNWNQILKVYLVLFQMWTFLKRPEQNLGTCWRGNTLT